MYSTWYTVYANDKARKRVVLYTHPPGLVPARLSTHTACNDEIVHCYSTLSLFSIGKQEYNTTGNNCEEIDLVLFY